MSNWQSRRATSRRATLLLVLAATALIATACGSLSASPTSAPGNVTSSAVQPSPVETSPVPTSTPDPISTVGPGLDVELFEQLNPRPQLRAVDRSIDFGFDEREALPRDLINPVYSPKFITPGEITVPMLDDELVMGLNINGDVRAYPVGIMRFREIVNDEVGGIPLLVTW